MNQSTTASNTLKENLAARVRGKLMIDVEVLFEVAHVSLLRCVCGIRNVQLRGRL